MDASFTKHRLPLVLSVAATVALVLTACGSTSGAPVTATGVKGGTLIMLGAGDVDHLDTASAYYTVSYTVERAYSRQLVSYPTSSDQQKAVSIVADAATVGSRREPDLRRRESGRSRSPGSVPRDSESA